MNKAVNTERRKNKRVYTRGSRDGGILNLIMGLEKPNKEEKLLRSILFSERWFKYPRKTAQPGNKKEK